MAVLCLEDEQKSVLEIDTDSLPEKNARMRPIILKLSVNLAALEASCPVQGAMETRSVII